MTVAKVEKAEGLVLRGAFVGIKQGKVFQDRQGVGHQRHSLGVEANGRTWSVSYRDAEPAESAWRDAGAPMVGQEIELPVVARIGRSGEETFIAYEGPYVVDSAAEWQAPE